MVCDFKWLGRDVGFLQLLNLFSGLVRFWKFKQPFRTKKPLEADKGPSFSWS